MPFEFIFSPVTHGLLLLVAPLILLPFLAKIQSAILRIILLTLSGISLPLLVGDVVLWSGALDDSHLWIPLTDTRAKQERDFFEVQESFGHPYGFRCQYRDAQKPSDVLRVAVFGDSFVWGEGLKNEDRWTTKLEQCLEARTSRDYQVLSWGRRGWATQQQLLFFKGTYQGWDIDHFILTFVRNDTDLGTLTKSHPALPINLSMVSSVYPNVTEFLMQRLRRSIYASHEEILEEALYSDSNLSAWTSVIKDYTALIKESGVPASWVLLPDPYGEDLPRKFNIASSILAASGFPVLNLLPHMEALTEKAGKDSLTAHRSDAHPGAILAQMYADEVCNHLTNTSRRQT